MLIYTGLGFGIPFYAAYYHMYVHIGRLASSGRLWETWVDEVWYV